MVFANSSDKSYKNLFGRVFSIGTFVANIVAIAAIVYVGIRYIFSGASGKADLKSRSPYFIIGIILAFSSVAFLSFLSDIINEITSV